MAVAEKIRRELDLMELPVRAVGCRINDDRAPKTRFCFDRRSVAGAIGARLALMLLILKFLSLTFSALLPVINPIGSALVFLGLVGTAPPQVYRTLARKIAFSTALFLLIIDVAGAAILSFFGISLPVVQFAGGLVLAAMGWTLLNQKEAVQETDVSSSAADPRSLEQRVFYPFTFPVTAGPGCLVVMLTLSAHASQKSLIAEVWAHVGILCGVVLISIAVYFAYAYSQKFTTKVSRQTVHGILRVIAFILLCIGVQIAWRGLQALIMGMPRA